MKKEYNNKYSVDFLFKEILPVLRQFKNRRQLSKKFDFINAFPTSEIQNLDDELIIELPTYLNALKIYALFYKYFNGGEIIIDRVSNMLNLNSATLYLLIIILPLLVGGLAGFSGSQLKKSIF